MQTKGQLLVEVGLIVSASVITYLMNFTLFLQDYLLSLLFRVILYVLDLGIFTAVLVAFQAKGGFATFYLLRVVGLIFSPSFQFCQTTLPAVIAYVLLKFVSYSIYKKIDLQSLDQENKKNRQQLRQKEQLRRKYFLVSFTLILLVGTVFITFGRYSVIPGILSIVVVGCTLYELYRLVWAQQNFSKMVSGILHLNIYVYLFITVVLAQLQFSKWYLNLEPAILYLSLLLLIIRITIGSQSSKFHEGDLQLFEAVYPFTGDLNHKRFRIGDNRNRMGRELDKLSRKLALIIYFFGIVIAAQQNQYYWLCVGFTLMKLYPLQEILLTLGSFLSTDFLTKARLLIVIPLVIFSMSLLFEEKCRQQHIYNTVNQCGFFSNIQIILFSGLSVLSLLSQFISQRIFRRKVHKALACCCPLLPIAWAINLQCDNTKHFLVMLYSLSLCLTVIRDDRLVDFKGQKKQ